MEQKELYQGYLRRQSAIRRRRQTARRRILLVCSAVLLAAGFFSAKHFLRQASANDPGKIPPPIRESVTETETLSDPAAQESTEPVSETVSETASEPESKSSYDYGKPVPCSEAVDTSYFDDAVFIGDSRTEGLILNTGLSNAISYTHKGLMVDTAFTNPVINKSGTKLSVMDALKETSFSKVYIMLGINETGWAYSSIFIDKYAKLIDEIRAINPAAVIYVQEILPVSEQVSSSHSYIKNSKIKEYNRLIREMAEEKEIYYIDTASAVASSGGSLPDDAASDGIHLKKDYCIKWLDWLKTHTI